MRFGCSASRAHRVQEKPPRSGQPAEGASLRGHDEAQRARTCRKASAMPDTPAPTAPQPRIRTLADFWKEWREQANVANALAHAARRQASSLGHTRANAIDTRQPGKPTQHRTDTTKTDSKRADTAKADTSSPRYEK